jgi:D-sedoheptulose 7-phosphate isomerase
MHWNEYLAVACAAAQSTGPQSLYTLAHAIFIAWKEGRTVFTCGNGGSAANASHLAQDLSKGTLVEGAKPMRCICLCDSVPSLTAWANDTEYSNVFASQLWALGSQGDLLIAISGSGNSPNILRAVCEAHELEMRTWGVTGFDGGKLVNTAHRCVHVPCADMGTVEAVHGILFHWLVDKLKHAIEVSMYRGLDEQIVWTPEAVS